MSLSVLIAVGITKGSASVVASAVVSALYTVPAADAIPFCPTPLVRLPCGSTSTRRTRRSANASAAARLIVVVVLPTPPFWFATATILAILGLFTNRTEHSAGQDTRRKHAGQLCSTWNTRWYTQRKLFGESTNGTVWRCLNPSGSGVGVWGGRKSSRRPSCRRSVLADA